MSNYDKYNIAKEGYKSLFYSPINNKLYVICGGLVSSVFTENKRLLLADLGGLDFFNNLEYIGEV